MNRKLQSRQIDAKELKPITPDTISKQALIHDEEYFDSLLKKSNIPVADRLIARVCQQRQIQLIVKKFRLENPGCEQWLPVQIELWEEKRQNKFGKNSTKTAVVDKRQQNGKKDKPKNISPTVNNMKEKKPKQESPLSDSKMPSTPKSAMKKLNPKSSSSKKSPKSFTPTFQVTQLKQQQEDKQISNSVKIDSIKTKSAVIKRIDLNSKSDKIIDDDDDIKNDDQETSPKKTRINDGFFLGEQNDNQLNDNTEQDFIQMRDISDDDDDDTANAKHKRFNGGGGGYKKKISQSTSFDRSSSMNNSRKSFINYSKQNNKSFTPNVKRQRYFDVDNQHQTKSSDSAKIHPSWQARMQSKEKQKISIDLSGKKTTPNKHIKFS